MIAHLKESEHSQFSEEHATRMALLRKSIQRIQEQTPVVTSKDLLSAGVLPSKKMGLLLKAAERISINEQIEDPAPILEKLKKSGIWP
jgi:hypothetical protein